jgi:hypothetical protein
VRREHTDMGKAGAKWGPNLDLWAAHARRQEQGPLLQGEDMVGQIVVQRMKQCHTKTYW